MMPRRGRGAALRLGVVLAAVLLLGGLSCSDQPAPLPPPEPAITSLRQQVRGVTDASLVALFQDDDDRLLIGSSYGEILIGSPGAWQIESLGAALVVTGIWAAPEGQPMAVAGNRLWQRDDDASWRPLVVPAGGNTLLDIWGMDAAHVWIVGTGGVILYRTAEGWGRAETPISDEVWGIGGSTPGDLVAVGQNGIILGSADGGLTWQREESPTGRTLFAVTSDGAGRMVAVGSGGTIVVREAGEWRLAASPTTATLFDLRAGGAGEFVAVGDGGTVIEGDGSVWHRVPVAGVSENLRGVVGRPGHRIAVGWYGAVLVESGGWTTVTAGSRLYGLSLTPDRAGWAVGTGGLAYRRVAGRWQPTTIPAAASLYAIDGPDAATQLAVGDSATVMLLSGGQWHSEKLAGETLLRSVWFDGHRALAVGAAGTAWARDDGVWHQVNSGSSRFLRQVAGTRHDRLFVVGDSGTMLFWDGRMMREVPIPTTANLRAVEPAQDDDIWVVGDGGLILRGDGVTWRRQASPTMRDIRAVRRIGSAVYIAGDAGEVFRYAAGVWQPVPVDGYQPGFWLAIDGDTELVLTGEVGMIVAGTL